MTTLGPSVTEQDLEQLTSLFRLLSDKTRLNILLLLAQGERNVSSLCEELNLPQPTVSHHLGLLRMNSVIANRRHGKQVFYALSGQEKSENMQHALAFAASKFDVKIVEKST